MKHYPMKQYVLIISALTLAASCGKSKSNSPALQSEDILVTSGGSLSIDAPKGVVFVHSFSPENKSQIYTATGDGGLGADLDSANTLTLLEGIKLSPNFENMDKSSLIYSLAPTGDKECNTIFSVDKERGLILVDAQPIHHLTSCSVEVHMEALSAGVSIHDNKKFNLIMNPTFAMYASYQDPVFVYLQHSSSLKSVELVAKWLKDPLAHPTGLVLKPEAVKATEGAVDIENIDALIGLQSLQKIDLSHSTIKEVNSLSYLENIQNINLSGTKIDPKKLLSLAPLKNIQTLDVSNTGLKDLNTVTENTPHLKELNISNNLGIKNLSSLSHLQDLRTLSASGVGLTHLKDIEGVAQLTQLDVSHNDLSSSSAEDIQILINLYNLTALDISETHIPNALLNSYFESAASRSVLKKLSVSHFYDMTHAFTQQECEFKANDFSVINHLKEIKSLEYIDIHGNGCNVVGLSQPLGLKDTSYFSNTYMPHLKYLDISDTPIADLSALQNSTLTELHLVRHPVSFAQEPINEGGIPMTHMACQAQLHNMPFHTECDLLGGGSQAAVDYQAAGTYSFTVPANVYFISVIGCSGGDGGQGGQGGQGGFGGQITSKNWDGWTIIDPPYSPSYFMGTSMAGRGAQGGQGGASAVEGVFMTTQETTSQAYNGQCAGGSGGLGGSGGGVNTGFWGTPKPGEPAHGANGVRGAHKKLLQKDNIPVNPGQVFTITVGNGGTGGGGSGSSQNGGCAWAHEWTQQGDIYCAGNGKAGGAGESGTAGYMKILWNQ